MWHAAGPTAIREDGARAATGGPAGAGPAVRTANGQRPAPAPDTGRHQPVMVAIGEISLSTSTRSRDSFANARHIATSASLS